MERGNSQRFADTVIGWEDKGRKEERDARGKAAVSAELMLCVGLCYVSGVLGCSTVLICCVVLR